MNALSEKSAQLLSRPAVAWTTFAIFCIAVYAYYPITLYEDFDLWFHLSYGRHFVENLTWNIDHTQFSWTPADPQWKYVTWIGSSILYLAYHIGSIPALSILQLLVLAAVVLLWKAHLRSLHRQLDLVSITCLLLTFFAMEPSADYFKPELFSVLFFSATAYIYARSKSSDRHFFAAYPPMFLVWVNTHGGFVIGLFFLAVVLFGEVLNQLLNPAASLGGKKIKALFLALAASGAATLINPNGIFYHSQLVNDFLSSSSMTHLSFVSAYKSAWQYLIPQSYIFRSINSAWAMVLMLLALLSLLLHRYRRERIFDLAILLSGVSLFLLGMQVFRLLIYFPLAWLFFVTYLLNTMDIRRRVLLYAPAAVLFLLATASMLLNTVFFVERASRWKLAVDEVVPVDAVRYMKDNRIQGPLFNDYGTGAFLMWSLYPEQKVFIDPRYWPYAHQVIPDYAELTRAVTGEKMRAFLAKYHFNAALIHLEELPLILELINNPEWRLLYFDKVAAIIVRRDIMDSIDPRAFNVEVGATRFHDVSHPVTLLRLFDLYTNINVAPRQAELILQTYRKNVGKTYLPRTRHIEYMEGQLMGLIHARSSREWLMNR